MKRFRIISFIFAVIFTIMVPINALGPISASTNEYTFTVSEYDALITHREKTVESMSIQGYSDEQIVASLGFEEEAYFLELSKLSEEVLKGEYGYNNEQIRILKEYDGSNLALNPQMKAIMGQMNGSIFCMLASTKSMRVRFNWQWRSNPVLLNYTDKIGFSWSAIDPSAQSIGLRHDSSNTSSQIAYYDAAINEYSHTNSATVNITQAYTGGYVNIPRMTTGGYLAKQGNIVLEVDVPSTTNALIAEAGFCFAYAMGATSISFSPSIPWGISVSFNSGAEEIFNEIVFFDCEGTLQ